MAVPAELGRSGEHRLTEAGAAASCDHAGALPSIAIMTATGNALPPPPQALSGNVPQLQALR